MRTTRSRRATVAAVPVLLAAAALLAGCSVSRGVTAGRGSAGPAIEPSGPASAGPTGTTPSGTGQPSGPGQPSSPTLSATLSGPGPSTASGGQSAPIPAAAMLRISDLRLWNRLANTSTSVAAIEQTEPSACEDHTAFPSDRHRIAAREHGYDNPAPESGGVRETVVRYAPGWAQELLAEARRVLSRCPRYTSTPGPTAQDRYEVRYVLERTLPGTGDDALLVRREQQYAGETRIWADYLTVVRVGNAVLTTMHELGEGVAARDVAVRLAGIGANRADCLRSSC